MTSLLTQWLYADSHLLWTGVTVEAKLESVRAKMKEQNAGALVVNALDQVSLTIE